MSKRHKPPTGKPARRGQTVEVKRLDDGDWVLVPPRCAVERADDLEEVQQMLSAGEHEIARDELRWLLGGCHDLLEAHKLLGEIALAEDDFALARGHFAYAYRLGVDALARAGKPTPLPCHHADNRAFHEAGKGLAWSLLKLGKRDMAEEIIAQLLRLDPSDPLNLAALRYRESS